MHNVFRTVKGALAMSRIVKDASRLDQVFSLSDTLADERNLTEIANRFALTPEGQSGLAARPRLGKLDLQVLQLAAPGTLAGAFAQHMLERQLDPDAIPSLPSADELQWVAAHLYETHDLWHVLTDFDTDVAGELGLQAFYAAQVGTALSFAILAAGMLNTALYCREDGDARMEAVARGWILGRQAHSLLGVRWNNLWHLPLMEVRARFGIRVG